MEAGSLPIGMFSRASSLSIKALRAYHEAGLLVPARVDPRTGYRIYTVDQLADAAIILRLRALDVPLAQVREVLDGRDPEITRRVLAAHAATMRARLADTERIVAELQSAPAPVTHTPVHVRSEQAHDTVRLVGEVTPEQFGDWLAWAFGRLSLAVGEMGIEVAGPPAALCDAEILDDDVETVEAFLPVSGPVRRGPADPDVAVGEVPAARVAVLVHTGPYATMPDTYRTLGAWVARHAGHAGERIREWYLVGSTDVDDPVAYRTEIAWPIC